MAKDSSFGQIWNQVNCTAIIQTVFSWPTKIGSYGFLPLITRKHHMVCELDILFLRREQPGALVHDGDLDNRLKVLFDGLRMPLHNDELEGLRDEPDLFCCLRADDSLITAGECANGTVVSAAGARYESVESSTCDRRSHSCDPCHLREYRTWRLVTMPSTDAAWIDAI